MSISGIVQGFLTSRKRRITRSFWAAAVALWLGLAAFLQTADAHAQLVRTTPDVGEKLSKSPAAVELLFNERLDPGGTNLTVLDEASRSVAKGTPERFEEGKGIRLSLPSLGEGHYTVSYSVISADGHPVSGAFVFTVGNPPPLPDAQQLDPHAQVGHNHGGSTTTDREFLIYATRIAYYAGLLGTAGLAMWSLLRGVSPLVGGLREKALSFAGKFTLLSTIAYIAISLMDLAQDEPMSEWLRILKVTTIGRLYDAELLLALAAPLLVSLGSAARLIWAAAFIGIEAWSGHASAVSPKAYMIALDFVHLEAASLWAGGLVLLLVIWLKDRPEAGRFALVFSRVALLLFLALWITGVLSVLDFLPSLTYLKYTLWGKWLLAKGALSLLVAVTAFLIRLRLRKGDLPHGFMLKADVGLLAAIVFVVGILTYQTPLPPNEPLSYHQMGTDMHLTLRITPNAPGDNRFIVKIWLPEQDGAPKNVSLKMLPLDRPDVGAIEVPIKAYQDDEIDAFDGYGKYTYQAEGPYLPFAAKWKAQVLVTDAKGNEIERETTFRIY
ncbi:copper resistance CopC/CopD family protein [Cohnella candidum]|uniref:Copper resistance protein CopC n=1 Tax=Cohnella candidum TaxID=2674991 RepID=A0A3G3K0G9_9BACL|nr:copper resistance protein CopC [Cohnella candidum]AYQ73607.1 copper resistance protein CopC [Cohnella candidum]